MKSVNISELSFDEFDKLLVGASRGATVPKFTAATKPRKATPVELAEIEHHSLEAIVNRLQHLMDNPRWVPCAYLLATTYNFCRNCGYSYISTDGLYIKSYDRRNNRDFKLELIPDSEGMTLDLPSLESQHSRRDLSFCQRCWPTASRQRHFVNDLDNSY